MTLVLLPLAAQKIEDEWLLFAIAGTISLVAFVTLIFIPAVSSYGRLWEKAAAGLLSIFVLLALVVAGIVAGLAFVYYYDEILRLLD